MFERLYKLDTEFVRSLHVVSGEPCWSMLLVVLAAVESNTDIFVSQVILSRKNASYVTAYSGFYRMVKLGILEVQASRIDRRMKKVTLTVKGKHLVEQLCH
jgi:predicted transcriptional regulator